MDVEVKGQKKKETKKASKVVRAEEPESTKKSPSKVEAKRTKPGAYEISQIKKMSSDQKKIAISFMESRNEARVKANMEPAYSQSDLDLYK